MNNDFNWTRQALNAEKRLDFIPELDNFQDSYRDSSVARGAALDLSSLSHQDPGQDVHQALPQVILASYWSVT